MQVLRKQRKSPENGDWKIMSWSIRCSSFTPKQRKSPENGDWKVSLFHHIYDLSYRNKESLLKMEIERLPVAVYWNISTGGKQRKSPENGDWKMYSIAITMAPIKGRNKESLLKMEIERRFRWNNTSTSCTWNKESLLKMEIESTTAKRQLLFECLRNKESLLKMEIERYLHIYPTTLYHLLKQRKSPENGDWKMSSAIFLNWSSGNKESLLKMEIER